MIAQQEVQTAITRILHAIDALDWRGVRQSFTAQVHVDYTPVVAGKPETLVADSLIARWQALLPGFDATAHLTGPGCAR